MCSCYRPSIISVLYQENGCGSRNWVAIGPQSSVCYTLYQESGRSFQLLQALNHQCAILRSGLGSLALSCYRPSIISVLYADLDRKMNNAVAIGPQSSVCYTKPNLNLLPNQLLQALNHQCAIPFALLGIETLSCYRPSIISVLYDGGCYTWILFVAIGPQSSVCYTCKRTGAQRTMLLQALNHQCAIPLRLTHSAIYSCYRPSIISVLYLQLRPRWL